MKHTLALIAALVLLVGCVSFPTHVFRTEQVAVDVAYNGYVGYTNWLLTSLADTNLSPARRLALINVSNDVKTARLRFAASVRVVDSLREAYETNSAFKPPLESALVTLTTESSNICWLLNYWRNQ